MLIKFKDNSVIKFEISPTDTVDSLKGLISKNKGIPTHQLKLTFNKLSLDNGKTLAKYNVHWDSTIHCVTTQKL